MVYQVTNINLSKHIRLTLLLYKVISKRLLTSLSHAHMQNVLNGVHLLLENKHASHKVNMQAVAITCSSVYQMQKELRNLLSRCVYIWWNIPVKKSAISVYFRSMSHSSVRGLIVVTVGKAGTQTKVLERSGSHRTTRSARWSNPLPLELKP